MRTHSAAGLVLLLATGLQACGSANGADAPKAGEHGAIAGPATTTEWFVNQARQARSRLRPLQRHVGRVLLPGDHGARRGAVRLRQRRRPRRLPRAGQMLGQSKAPRDAHLSAAAAAQATACFATTSPWHADGTRTLRFTDVTDGSGIDVARLRHGRGGRRLRQRRLRRPVPAPASARTSCSATTATARSPTSRRRAAPTIAGLERLGVVRRLRPRRLARPLRRQLPDYTHRGRHRLPAA